MTQPGDMKFNSATVWAGVALVVAIFAAAVALAFTGWEPGAIVGFLAGIAGIGGTCVALLDKLTTVQRVNVEQTHQLDTIERRTNGELDQRIEAGSRAAAVQAAEEVWQRIMNSRAVDMPEMAIGRKDE